MVVKCKASRVEGVAKCAVYEGADDVFSDPFSDISRVRFHSDFQYPSITEIVTGSVTLPAIAADTQRYHTYELYEHGVGGHPFVTGMFTDYPASGVNVAMEGSVPVYGDIYGFARWLTLGSDDENVILHEQTITRNNASMPELTIDYELRISDLTVEGYDGSAPGGEILKITPYRIVLGEGRFDSEKRYLKAVSEADKDTNFVGGQTLAHAEDAANYDRMPFEYSNGEYTYRKSSYQSAFPSGSPADLDFTPDATPVKI